MRRPGTKFWALLFVVALLGCGVWAWCWWTAAAPGTIAQIYSDGVLVRTIDLSQVEEGYTFQVDGPSGANVVEVEPGRIRVQSADCPDQVCVHQGWISDGAVPIVCLPNRLVIRLTSESDQEIDGVAQ